jgi:hypothetical protein
VVVVSCPRTGDYRVVSDSNGEFSAARLSMLAGGCSLRAEKRGYRGEVVRPDGTCGACTVEVPLILECAPLAETPDAGAEADEPPLDPAR